MRKKFNQLYTDVRQYIKDNYKADLRNTFVTYLEKYKDKFDTGDVAMVLSDCFKEVFWEVESQYYNEDED